MKIYIGVISVILFLQSPNISIAQTVEIKDSIRNNKNNHETLNLVTYGSHSLRIDNNISVNNDNLKSINKISVSDDFVHVHNNLIPPSSLYSHISKNPVEGLTMKGLSHIFYINNFLLADIDFYVSEYYNGLFMPNPYLNGSVRLGFTLKLHERVQIVGMGQLSLREGVDPKVPSILGSSNYYGAGIKVKVNNKIGFGVGVTNNYYRGSWSRQTYFTPVGY